MPLLCAIAIVRPEMKVIRGDSSVLLPGSSLHSARASKNYNLILFRTILHPPDSFVSKNEGMAEGACPYSWGRCATECHQRCRPYQNRSSLLRSVPTLLSPFRNRADDNVLPHAEPRCTACRTSQP